MTLAETAEYVRSKNAGPFVLTIDIFCGNEEAYEAVKNSKHLAEKTLEEIYHVNHVEKYTLDNLKIVNFFMTKPYPQGSPHDGDMHGGQQYVRLLDIQL